MALHDASKSQATFVNSKMGSAPEDSIAGGLGANVLDDPPAKAPGSPWAEGVARRSNGRPVDGVALCCTRTCGVGAG